MNKLLIFFIIFVVFSSAAEASQISGTISSDNKKLADLIVTLSKINGTVQNEESITGVVYEFYPLTKTKTDVLGNYIFKDLSSGEYRINVTYEDVIQGENIKIEDNAVADFNLSGKIEGYVLKANATLEGTQIRLFDVNGIEISNTLTDKTGKYSFNKLNAGKQYNVGALYADVPYINQVEAPGTSDFVVYETTDDGAFIAVSIDHVVLSSAPNGIRVDEFMEFINTGDKVFFSKDRTWLGISTPKDITGFQTDVMECCLVRENDIAWVDPMKPIMPGEKYNTQISYLFNPQSEPILFNKKFIYNTYYAALLSEKSSGFGIESIYGQKETTSNQGKEFEVLSFVNIQAGQSMDTTITGYIPQKTGEDTDLNYLIPAVVVLFIGAISYPLIKNRIPEKTKRIFFKSTSSVQVPSSGPGEVVEISQVNLGNNGMNLHELSFHELLAERNLTFQAITTLDNEFGSENIEEEEYKHQRKEYKEKVILILKRLKEEALNLDLSQSIDSIEKIIGNVDDVDILEDILKRETEGENRSELKKIIEERIEDIERDD